MISFLQGIIVIYVMSFLQDVAFPFIIYILNFNKLSVKLFQAIASNHNLLSRSMLSQISHFVDNVPYLDSEIPYDLIARISDEYNLCAFNVTKPINSGLISLVYKVYVYGNHKPMILKIKRVGIEERLMSDATDLLWIISFFTGTNSNIYVLAESLFNVVIKQTNFIQEVENTMRMKTICKTIKYVVIPSVQPEVTNKYPDCILMDFIDGVKLNQVAKEDYVEYAKLNVKFGFITSFIHNISHGDLHDGNILFIKSTGTGTGQQQLKLGIIDFGIIYEFTNKAYKNAVMEIIIGKFAMDSETFVERLIETNAFEPIQHLIKNKKKVANELAFFLRDVTSSAINIKSLSHIYNKIITLLTKYHLHPSKDFAQLQMVFSMSHGVTFSLCNKDMFHVLLQTIVDDIVNKLSVFTDAEE